MYNLHHETNSEPNLSLSTFKPLLKVSTSTHSTSAHTLNVGLTNCLIPAPARTESCQRHTAGTTCRLLSPCTRPLTAPLSVTPSLTGLNDALQPNRTASPLGHLSGSGLPSEPRKEVGAGRGREFLQRKLGRVAAGMPVPHR